MATNSRKFKKISAYCSAISTNVRFASQERVGCAKYARMLQKYLHLSSSKLTPANTASISIIAVVW